MVKGSLPQHVLRRWVSHWHHHRMSDHLIEAARAHRDAKAREAAGRQILAKAKADLKVTRPRLIDAIVKDARAGTRPTRIVEVTGWTYEYVRRILRRAGVPPIEDE